MIATKKYRYKPLYKQFVKLRNNTQNRIKLFEKESLLKFNKLKWKIFKLKLERVSKTSKRNGYYKFYDQTSYKLLKFNNFFSKNYKTGVSTKKSFKLFYGDLREKYVKNLIKISNKSSNQINNKINKTNFFNSFLEKRLDVIIFRSHFVLSIRNARQLISHKHVLVNNQIITNSSFLVKKGDCITFKKKTHKLIKHYLTLSQLWPLPPKYTCVNYKLLKIQIINNVLESNNLFKYYLWLNLNDVLKIYLKK